LLNNHCSGVALLPQRNELRKICKNMRAIFHYKLQYSASQIISIVNPILKGWCIYFSLGQSYIYRRKLEYYLHRLV
jgi:hypothetical protein